MTSFTEKRIGVFGLGVEGESSARFLVAKGATVTVFDEREEKELNPALLQELKQRGVRCVFGSKAFSLWDGCEMIVRSPGMRRFRPELVAAERAGVRITSQIQLFFDLSPAPIIGVTGTKGKGTTSTLIHRMLKTEGMDAYLGGNIGQPPFTFLERLTSQSMVVLELSSFQLEDLHKSPHIAVMLMVTSEHLGADTTGTANYHDSLEGYVEAKRTIVKFQTAKDIAVLNRDYPATIGSQEVTPATIYQVSRTSIDEVDGCFVRDGAVWFRMHGKEEFVIKTAEVALPGQHNHENVCAASMAAHSAGVSIASIQRVLKEFHGLEHRLEYVGEVDGIKYYDDSFSTTPETAIAAIQAFTAPKVLILGGSTKKSDFTELAKIIVDVNIRGIVGIGIEWERIKQALAIHEHKIPLIEGCADMPSMVQAANELAQPGDVVLLSPACASFGLFPNYKVRGEQFKQEVKKRLK